MKNIHISPFKADHIEALLELIRLNTPQYFASYEEEEFKDYLETKTELYFIFEHEGQVVAGAGVNFSEDKKEAFMSWGMVHPNLHGKGIGTIMTNYRLQVLQKTEGLEKITLKTSQKTYAFYEKLGFETKFTKKDFWSEGLDLVQMEYNILS